MLSHHPILPSVLVQISTTVFNVLVLVPSLVYNFDENELNLNEVEFRTSNLFLDFNDTGVLVPFHNPSSHSLAVLEQAYCIVYTQTSSPPLRVIDLVPDPKLNRHSATKRL
jgi:hypothetical protein